MDFLKDLFSPITERIRNQFYGTFIISWLIVNWRIWLAILSDPESLGGRDKMNYIADQIGIRQIDSLLLYPLIITGVYLFALPYLDYWIFIFTERRKNIKHAKRVELGQLHPVSGKKHMELLLRYNSEIDRLAKLNSDIEEKQAEINEQSSENQKIINENSILKDKIEDFEVKFKANQTSKLLSNVLKGEWLHKNKRTNTNEELKIERYNFENNEVKIIENRRAIPLYYVIITDFDPFEKKLKFAVIGNSKERDNIGEIRLFELRKYSDALYKGTERKFSATVDDFKIIGFDVVFEKVN